MTERETCTEYYVANSILVSVSQASLFGSEIWFVCLAVDLFLSLSNPFSNYKTNRRRYYVFVTVITVLSCAAWLLVLNDERLQGVLCTQLNAFHQAQASPVWVVLLFGASYLVWLFCIPILVFAYQKLKQGLSETLEKRQEAIVTMQRWIFVHALYTVLCAGALIYTVSRKRDQASTGERAQNEEPHGPYCAVLAPMLVLRGLVTFIVWVSLHRSAVWARVRADGFGGDSLSPALNHELRKEVVGCTTRGIRIAVAHRRKFQLQWSRDGSYSYAFVDIFLAPRDETRQRCYDSFEQDGGSRHSLLPHTTGPSSTQTVKFRDHEPDLFRELRELLGISNDEYLESLRSTTKESFGDGGSGAFMYFSMDHRFIVKTTSPQEAFCLLRRLRSYHKYTKDNPRTFLTRFLGCHFVQMYGKRMFFVVMVNFLAGATKIHEKYDLKGSWENRNGKKPATGALAICRRCNQSYIAGTEDPCMHGPNGTQHVPIVVLKDNDLNYKVNLEASLARAVSSQLHNDAQWLGSHNIMDYSLLIGVQHRCFVIENPHAPPSVESALPSLSQRPPTLSSIYVRHRVPMLHCDTPPRLGGAGGRVGPGWPVLDGV